MATGVDNDSGDVTNADPADLLGPSLSFQPDPPAPLPYDPGTSCNDPGNGKCTASTPLAYALRVDFCSEVDEAVFTQDTRDVIRQEYANHNIDIPERIEIQPPTGTTNFSVDEITMNSNYRIVLGEPGLLAQSVRDRFNELLSDDVQLVPFGEEAPDAMAPIVQAGEAIPTILRAEGDLDLGVLLDTPLCNDGPPECDDEVVGTTIVAEPNRIAETRAIDTSQNIGLVLTSAWRNPERNEAVNGAENSRHQFGNAVDLVPGGEPANADLATTYCILEAVGDEIAQGVSERRSTQVLCTDPTITHIHVEQE